MLYDPMVFLDLFIIATKLILYTSHVVADPNISNLIKQLFGDSAPASIIKRRMTAPIRASTTEIFLEESLSKLLKQRYHEVHECDRLAMAIIF